MSGSQIDREAIVIDALELLNAHDVEAYLAACSPDVVRQCPMGQFSGVQANRTYLSGLDAIPDHWRRVQRSLVSGNDVATWLRWGGTVDATGRSFEIDGCTIFTVDDDGRISAVVEYWSWDLLVEPFRPLA
jgi:ketosteroid isomerase-like protein